MNSKVVNSCLLNAPQLPFPPPTVSKTEVDTFLHRWLTGNYRRLSGLTGGLQGRLKGL